MHIMKRTVLCAALALFVLPGPGTASAQQIFQGSVPPPGGGQFPGGPGGPFLGGPPRDSRPPAVAGSGVIRGKVVAADSGRPLRRARVTVTAPELGPGDNRATSTSAD